MNDMDDEPPTRLSHVDETGTARMVDVGAKAVTVRTAAASGHIQTAPETIRLIEQRGISKGDVLTVARVAGIMAAKRTPDLIPLCHGLLLSSVDVDIALDRTGLITITATARAEGKTGVEMEALTAVSVAALTVYDMCKAVDRGMCITHVRLEQKAGGRSGEWRRDGAATSRTHPGPSAQDAT